MRTEQEIKQMIKEIEANIEYHSAWYVEARKKYDHDVKTFGKDQADDSEMRVANNAYWEARRELRALNWVLGYDFKALENIHLTPIQ